MDRFRELLAGQRIIAVLVIDEATDAVPLAETLLEGGVGAMELTLRTPAALEAMSVIRERVPEILVGAGTVLTREQVRRVGDAGAAFAVAPGLNRDVMEEAASAELPFAPGVMTPSEIEAAVELGCRTLKFFPAEPCGGLKYLKSAAGPYKHLDLQFIPLGGLNQDNLPGWLESPLICAVGGSWIAPRDLIREHRWEEIGKRAAAAAAVA
ncbi:bifunctional 4-hydroxy-2-oxoglutarate aldolase/2-dehydro-3-deoxy-phosphogluconate aldolase [Kiritimatiella glycovorans]|uniref:2-dehydro-3-deoxy-phosphogluconate aldolase n=1 Tax=Kiritimatiella glycovorans TaxID=1307763 RepID=A0A0G3EF12_9BACT|nr:bifunctional 4-hydroxy-2-oxoglutarate aldolase/2-dehydro-3-deoxy-phosphogluconate aldolase [Kiritimatiella glycovorans]AKJ64918.1 Putative KHG/KDPG aldolase [Kiritimatiella glycovorans]